MWVVLGDDNEVIMYLAHGEVIVGRSSHQSKLVLVREDVSRMHAKLFVDSLASDGVGVVSVEDASKVGTFVNGARVPSAHKTALVSGDQVRLGSSASFMVARRTVRVSVSSLIPAAERAKMAELAAHMGIELVGSSAAGPVDAVVAQPGKLTPSALEALVRGLPVVEPAALDAALARCNQHLPTGSGHPLVDAAAAGPFAVRHGGHRVPLRSRSTLLAGDLLVFFDEPTHSAFARLLSRAGADCRLLQDDASDSVVEAVQARARRKRSRSGMPPAVIVVPLQPKSPPTRAALRANRAAVTAIKAAGALRVGARTIVDALAAGVSYEAYATASASQQPSLTPSMAPSDSGTLEAAAAITARHDAPSKRQRDQAGAEVAANAPLEASGPAPKRPRGEPLLADAAPSLPSEASSVMAHFAGSDGVAEAANGPAAEAANSVEPTTMTRGPDPASEEADGWLRGDDEDCDGGGRRLSDEDPRRAGVDAGIAALARDVAAGRALVVSVGARADASPPPDGVAVVSSTPGWGTAPAASAELFQAEAGEWVPCDAGEAEDGVAGEASAADLERWLSRPMAGETLRELRRRVGGSARPEAEPEPTRADLARGMGRPLGRAGRDASREGEEGEREGAIASLEAGADTAWQSPAVLSVPLSALLARSDPQASAQVEVSDVTSYYDRAPGGGGEGSQQGRPFMKQWPAAGRAASARFQLAASSAVSPSAVAFVQERRDTARVARQEAEAFAAAQHPKLRRKGGRSTAGVGATAAAWDGEEAGQGVIEAPAKRQAAAAACPPIKPRSGGQQALLPGAAPPARAAATVKTTRRRRR